MFENLSEDLLAAAFEFVGTTLFLLLGLGGIQATSAEIDGSVATTSNLDKVFSIASSMGFSLLVTVWIFYRITGAVFNPNVSLALLLVGAMPPVRFLLYSVAQFIGGIAASAIVEGLTPGPLVSK